MVAVKCGLTETTRATLEFGVNPAIFLSKDADGSIPLHIAVQNTSTALAELLIQYGPTGQLYMENSVGQTPLEIAGL
jgi:ankyrin repeat protein